MELNLKGKTAVILASSKGIGKACAVELAREGCNVAICSRSKSDIDAVQKEILMFNRKVFSGVCDVTNREDMMNFMKSVRSELGKVNILVNNCGGPAGGSFHQIKREDWDDAFKKCLMQVVDWTYEVVPEMVQNKWGRILNIVSTSVRQPIDGLLLSNSIRPGVIGFTKSVSKELAPNGVTFNSILPGSILTDRQTELAMKKAQQTGESIDRILEKKIAEIPMKRYGRPEEIGYLAAFLCSDLAAYITGASFQVDGGLLKSTP